MEHYNDTFLQQLAPLIKVHVNKDVDEATSQLLLKWLNSYDVYGKIWDNSIIKDRLSSYKYRISVVDTQDVSYLDMYKSSGNEHSQLSPFNINSDLFPNGIISEKWIEKYTKHYPFAFVIMCNLPDIDKDIEMADEIWTFKNRLLTFGIKLVVIIISNSEDSINDEVRINDLRNLTQLPRHNGLLYLNSNIEGDFEILITNLLKNLKNSANIFYNSKESKIQQRNEKYYTCPSTISINTGVEITPIFLETRNLLKQSILTQFYLPHNLQPAIKLLEIAYNNLTEILLDCFDGKLIKQYNLSDHDLNLYFQFRNLVDMIAFHIVRGYYSLDDPLQALKKHGAHVAIVTDIANSQYDTKDVTRYWQSIQYKWLGQLMDKIPSSIVSNTTIPPTKKKSTILSYFGGIKFIDRLSYQVYLTPDLNFMHAYSLLEPAITTITPRDFLLSTLIPEDIKNLKINLLESALSYLESQKDSSQTIVSYVYWLMAEEHDSISSEESLSYYENSLKHIDDIYLQNLILIKLLDKYQKLNPSKFLITLIQLVTFTGKPKKVFPDLNLQDIEGVSISYDMLEVESLVINQNHNHETYIYENCTSQLIIKSKCNLEDLQLALPNNKVEFVVNKIEIDYENEDKTEISGFKPVIIHNSSALESSKFNLVEIEQCDNHLEGAINLKLGNEDFKIVQFNQPAQRAGTFKIQSIKFEASLIIDNIIFDIQQTNTIESQINRDIKLYNHEEINWIRLNNDCNTIQIKPVKPNIELISQSIENICIGEKVSIPITIKFHHPKHKRIKYQFIELVPTIRISSDEQAESDLTTLVNWDELKDDEPLNIRELTEGNDDGGEQTHNLNISLIRSPNDGNNDKNYTMIVDIKTRVAEFENEIESVYENHCEEYPIINSLFDLNLIISPRYDDNESKYMPSPFVIPENTSNLVLPIPVRLWAANVQIKQNLDIEVTSVEFDIKPNNNEVIIDKQEESLVLTPKNYHQLFTTKSKSGYSHRTITTTTIVKIKWNRKTNNIQQTYTSEEWEIVLPLSDPRVLLTIKEDTDKKIELRYILENPTPRIFNFTTQLIAEPDWKFDHDDARNIVPLKQEVFQVLPFSRHAMNFYGEYPPITTTTSYLKLPIFKVYDVNYKFGLPTLSINENIMVRNGLLYWKIESK